MSKITKKELLERIKNLEKQSSYVDGMLTELNHASSDTPELKLKQLDQSVFDGLDEKWKLAAVDADGRVFTFKSKPSVLSDGYSVGEGGWNYVGEGYDASNWQNSLIERDKVELTGRDLCRAMLARGDRWVLVKPSDHNDKDALSNNDYPELVTEFDQEDFYCIGGRTVEFAVPINSVTGEPLTATDVGL